MAATFDLALSTAKDRLRLRAGDTDVAAPILHDETYVALLSLNAGDETRTLLDAVRAILSVVSQQPDRVTVEGAVTLQWGARIARWREQAAELSGQLGTVDTSGGFIVARPTRTAAVANEFGTL